MTNKPCSLPADNTQQGAVSGLSPDEEPSREARFANNSYLWFLIHVFAKSTLRNQLVWFLALHRPGASFTQFHLHMTFWRTSLFLPNHKNMPELPVKQGQRQQLPLSQRGSPERRDITAHVKQELWCSSSIKGCCSHSGPGAWSHPLLMRCKRHWSFFMVYDQCIGCGPWSWASCWG